MNDPVITAFEALRIVAIALAAYILIGTALGVAARVLRLRWLATVTDAISTPLVKRLVAAAMGASLLTAPTAAPAAASPNGGDTSNNRTPPVMVVIPDGAEAMSLSEPPAVPAPSTPTPPVPVTNEAVVRAGDNLWEIAESRLEDSWGRRPTNAELVSYWRDLIDRNASRFMRPGNANLVFPGQVMELPPVPPMVSAVGGGQEL